MNCIKDDLIQQYIDGETKQAENDWIKEHLSNCEKCTLRVEHQRNLAAGIKKMLNVPEVDDDVTKVVPLQQIHSNEKSIRYKKWVYILAVASVLVFIFLITKRHQISEESFMILEPGFASGYDANKPVSDQDLIIEVIDENGRAEEFFFE